MATPALTPIVYTDRYYAYDTQEGDLVLVERFVGRPPRQIFQGRDAVRFFLSLCSHRTLFYCWRKSLLARFGDDWEQLRNVQDVDAFLCDRLHFCGMPNTIDPAAVTWGNCEPDASLRVRLEAAGLIPFETAQRTICERLLASAKRFPAVEGFVSHPVHEEPGGEWLRPSWRDLGGVDTGYPHLRRLFSAFELHPVDHAMLLSYFLGCFHAASLDHPRPLLVIDSAMQGRGKGEIGTALSVLLDNKQSSVPISGRHEAVTTKVVSHLIGGSRTLACQNVSGRADWNNEFIVCLSTDGNVSERALYDRESTPFAGIVGSISAVYGQATFDHDVVDRAWRVFLRGEAQKLDPQPAVYVVEHRDALIDEIMVAHSRASRYTEPTHSRFAHFEQAAGGAYAEVMNVSHGRVHDWFSIGRYGARALLTSAVQDLHKHRPKAFARKPHREVLGGLGTTTANDNLEGARALGLIYHEGDWHEETD